MGRKLSPRKILNYVVFVIVALMAYKVFFQSEKKKDFDPEEHHPRKVPRQDEFNEDFIDLHRPKGKGRSEGHKANVKPPVEDPDEMDDDVDEVNEKERYQADSVVKDTQQKRKGKIDKHKDQKIKDQNIVDKSKNEDSENQKHNIHKDKKGDKRDAHKPAEPAKTKNENLKVKDTKTVVKDSKVGVKEDDDKARQDDKGLHEEEDRLRIERLKKLRKGSGDFDLDGVDMQIAKEKNDRRKGFFASLSEVHEPVDEDAEDEHFHERDDDLTITSAVWSDNFMGALQLVDSVQRNLPRVEIGLFDLGLTAEQRRILQSLCRVKVHRTLLIHMPKHIQDLSRNLWRPFVLQMALGTYGHVIYISPERKLKSVEDFKGFVAQSRIGGVSIIGRRKDYSTYVVTHPDMYHYFNTDIKKLQRTKHIEISMIILHNTAQVRMRFMRWLYGCAMEEWCIAPPGSHTKCDHRLHANSRQWANCHRYDESAINMLLASWHKYDTKHYVRRDTITAPYDGWDVRKKLQYCDTSRGDL